MLPNSRKTAKQQDRKVQSPQRNLERLQTLVDSFITNPADPPIAVTPHQVIWKRGKTRLLRYGAGQPSAPSATNPLPYLIVPWLGISRPYVLDLLPGNSMIEYLVNHGHDVYLLDWGEIALRRRPAEPGRQGTGL